MTAVRQAEYLWLDGATPTQRLRSKTRIVAFPENEPVTLKAFPTWSFDGSSTYQADGHDSDLILKPATFIPDPLIAKGVNLSPVHRWGGTPLSDARRNNHEVVINLLAGAGEGRHPEWSPGTRPASLLCQDALTCPKSTT
jgi:hypothetical protein